MLKMGDIRCRKCGRNAMESRSYLKRDGVGWACVGGCDGKKMSSESALLDAVSEGDRRGRK